MLACLYEAVAAGDDEGDPPPAGAGDRRQLVLQGTKLQLIVPIAGAEVVRLRLNQVTARDQFVAFDGGLIVDGPLIILEDLGGVVDTNRKTSMYLSRSRLIRGLHL